MADTITNAQTSVFSGADVVVIFGDHYVGECMSFTIGVNREAGPLYVMGRKEPIAIPKGKRGIGGSFILAQLGYDALLQHYADVMGSGTTAAVWIRNDEMVPETNPKNIGDQSMNAAGVQLSQAGNGGTASSTSDLWTSLVSPNYVDQMPPFNITVVGMNEQGKKMGFRVYGVVIINDGMAISIEELNMEKKYTFIAQAVSRMQLLNG
jgi:hypothetical protein